MEPFSASAVVVTSSRTECVLGDLDFDFCANGRRSVRYPLSPPAHIYAMEDRSLQKPQECKLLDISVSGACIVSSYDYAVGDLVRLRVELVKGGGYTSYHSEVVRMRTLPNGGGKEYGLLFAQLDKRKMAELLRDIETIQNEAKKRVNA